MDSEEHVVPEGARGVIDDSQVDIDGVRWGEPAGDGQHVAALEVVLGQADEVGCHSRARWDCLQLPLVALQAANPRRETLWKHFDLLTDAEGPIDERARDDGAEAGHRERAVEGEARASKVFAGTGVMKKGFDGLRQLREAVAGRGRDGNDRYAFEGRAFENVLDFRRHELEPLVVHEIALGDGHEAAADVQQVENGEVLPCLGHHRLVGGDHEESQVDAAHAGEHVVDESFVTGNVDDADLAAVGQGHPGETEVDGQAPLLLLLEAVGVDAG